MKGYYDNMVPKSLMKIAKKLDPNAKLGTSTIKGLDVANPNRFERGREVPSMEITPLMRERIKQGLPQYQRGGRVGFADGGDVDTSMLEPVDHDPFPPEPQVQDSDIARAKGFPEPRSPMHARLAALGETPAPPPQSFTGHVAAEQVPGQNLTPKYLAAHPQGSLSPGDPSLGERLQQGVSETAQRAGVPVQGAERMGETVRTGAEYAPVSSNILSAADAYQAGQRGDVLGAITGAIGAVPIPGAGSAERAGVGAIERGADGILRHADPAFQEGRIATTTPWSKKLGDPHQSGEATIGHDTMQASGETYDKTAGIIKEMPYTGVKTRIPAQNGQKAKTTTTWTPTGDLNIDPNATPEEAHEAFIEHAKSNILALHDAVPDDIRQGSMQWYDGANTIAKQRAQQYDKPLENIAGTYAALSPQMDWYKNASLGDRVMDISTRQGNSPFSPEMQNWVNGYLTNSSSADTAKSAAIFDKIKDTPLGQVTDPLERAHWIRAYDEAHNDRAYNLVNPDGTFGDTVKKGDGTNAGAGWGSMDAITNAVTAFDAKDMPTISEAMGGGHKVRNFYNNILDPNAPTGDVTVDTHAIAAALLRPLSRLRQRHGHRTWHGPSDERDDWLEGPLWRLRRGLSRAQPPSAISCRARCNPSPGRRSEASTVRLRSASPTFRQGRQRCLGETRFWGMDAATGATAPDDQSGDGSLAHPAPVMAHRLRDRGAGGRRGRCQFCHGSGTSASCSAVHGSGGCPR